MKTRDENPEFQGNTEQVPISSFPRKRESSDVHQKTLDSRFRGNDELNQCSPLGGHKDKIVNFDNSIGLKATTSVALRI